MALISKPFTFSAGAVIIASQHNSDFDTVYNLVNGALDSTNLASNAAIADTQLAQITTAGKVSGAALTSFSSIPSGAGLIPAANLQASTAISFSVHKNGTNQTGIVTATPTKLTWPTESWDTNNYFASDKFTPLTAGKYNLNAGCYLTVGVDQTQYDLRLYKNGALEKILNLTQCSGTGGQLLSGSAVVIANGSTDYFEIFVIQSSGGDKIADGASYSTYFQGYLIGA